MRTLKGRTKKATKRMLRKAKPKLLTADMFPQVTVTYCTVTQIKDLMRGTDYSELGYADDAAFIAAIAVLITQAEKIIDNHCHRTFTQVTGATEIFDGPGGQIYIPENTPVISASKLEERGDQTDSWSTITTTDYCVYKHHLFYESGFTLGNKNYQLTYTYGYATVPKDIELACILISGNAIHQRRLNMLGKVLPFRDYEVQVPAQDLITPDIAGLLKPYVRMFVA